MILAVTGTLPDTPTGTSTGLIFWSDSSPTPPAEPYTNSHLEIALSIPVEGENKTPHLLLLFLQSLFAIALSLTVRSHQRNGTFYGPRIFLANFTISPEIVSEGNR